MNIMKIRATLLILTGALSLCSTAFASGVDASSVKITVYGVAVSQNEDCSNGKVLLTDTNGKQYDFMQGPAIISGNIDPGTYKCVMLYINTKINFTPSQSTTHCTAGVGFDYDVNTNNTYTATTPDSDNILQFTGTLTNSQTDKWTSTGSKAVLFISTGSIGTNGSINPFSKPTGAGDSSNGVNLGSALVVSSSGTTGTFVTDFRGTIGDEGTQCGSLSPPTFSFR